MEALVHPRLPSALAEEVHHHPRLRRRLRLRRRAPPAAVAEEEEEEEPLLTMTSAEARAGLDLLPARLLTPVNIVTRGTLSASEWLSVALCLRDAFNSKRYFVLDNQSELLVNENNSSCYVSLN